MVFNSNLEVLSECVITYDELKELAGEYKIALENIGYAKNDLILENKISTETLDIKDKSMKKNERRFIFVGRDSGSHNSTRIKITKVIAKGKSISTKDHTSTIFIYDDNGKIESNGDGMKFFTNKDIEVYKDFFRRNEDLLNANKNHEISDDELERLIIERESKRK